MNNIIINFSLSNLNFFYNFYDKFGFPYVIGAIDCTHVAIIASPDRPDNPTISYYNRKAYYSINVQAVKINRTGIEKRAFILFNML